ncbi:hypothetical protein GCM10007416_34870 [Kroppenstedtia guangzhouensis]|uniref:Nitroreductase domain-containing protein n=1 Tax=Kroppenstedtia guangzhouensis TaxID=1274356 RepID=A0ABQ1H4S1_9BACL|nr:nitroreductase family protein [Kroppenstedtia guangzhouensis]GGA58717.1 hypothetical protein GCM10007416_34870 [Kroppenstedtia guangzhouensis]
MVTVLQKEKKSLVTNPGLVMVQSRLYSSAYSGPGKWIIYNPENRRAFLAVGKDILPEIVPILAKSSDIPIKTDLDGKLKQLMKAGLIIEKDNADLKNMTFVHRFQRALLDYPGVNYFDKDWRKKDYQLMDSYASMWDQPPKITPRFGSRIPLPKVNQEDLQPGEKVEPLSLRQLAAILRYVFGPIGKIKGQFGPNLRKTNPSGGAKHPTECVVILPRSYEYIQSGMYVYDVENHALIREEGYPKEGLYSLNKGTIGFLLRSRVERPMWRYREIRSFRPILLDVGHVLENLSELARIHGLSSKMAAPLVKEDENFTWLQEPEMVTLLVGPEAELDETTWTIPKKADLTQRPSKHFMTNPAVYFSFKDGSIHANVLWPRVETIPVSFEEFNIITHCLPSRRGDRNTTVKGVIESIQNTVPDNVQKLIRKSILLPDILGRNFYRGLELWVRHSWYLSFLAHLEGRNYLDQIQFVSLPDDNILTKENINILFNRHTTRVFSPQAVTQREWKYLMDKAFPIKWLTHQNLRIFLAAQNIEGVPHKLYEWDYRERKLVSLEKKLTSKDIRAMTSGMEFAGTGAISLWVWKGLNLNEPGTYETEIMKLGQIGQRICLACTEMELGVFLTPGIRDTLTFDTLGIDQRAESVVYYFNIGRKPIKGEHPYDRGI